MTAPKRALMVDGPMRGWDVPYPGGVFIVFPLPRPPRALKGRYPDDETFDATTDEAKYRIDPVRSRTGEIFMLGFLSEDFTHRVSP